MICKPWPATSCRHWSHALPSSRRVRANALAVLAQRLREAIWPTSRREARRRGPRAGSFDGRSDRRPEFSGLGDTLWDDTVVGHQCVKLLLLVWNSRRQRCDVPVDVGVALHASQRQDRGAFGRNDLIDGARDPVHDRLESKVLVGSEVTNNVFDMASRRHECVATHCGVAAQERDVEAVVVEQLFVFHPGFTGHDGGDEAATGPDATLIGCDIKWTRSVIVLCFGNGMNVSSR